MLNIKEQYRLNNNEQKYLFIYSKKNRYLGLILSDEHNPVSAILI